jgi:hypothetical protein
LQLSVKAIANWRAPFGAVLSGAGMGLGLGAAFMIFGMAGHAADHAYAVRLADAAATGYTVSHLETEGRGLRVGLEQYGFQGALDAVMAPARAEKARQKSPRRADLECLTTAVYFEARGESPRGQAAVAQVVLNRVKHKAFPKSVCGVVFQGAGRAGCQFSFACDGSMRKRKELLAWNRARNVAARALAGAARADIGAATHFHTTAVSPIWAPQMLRVANVGAHVFYKFAPYRLRTAPAAPPAVEQALLTAGVPGAQVPELRIAPAMEQAIETSLEPASPAAAEDKAATGTAAPAADEARLAPAQPAAAAGAS